VGRVNAKPTIFQRCHFVPFEAKVFLKKKLFSRSHALAWERILDAPASKLNENFHLSFLSVMMNWTLARPDCIPTPARGNEKIH